MLDPKVFIDRMAWSGDDALMGVRTAADPHLTSTSNRKRRSFLRLLVRDRELYLMALPVIVFFIIFHYGPIYGLQIAFKDFRAIDGIWGSEWVGLKHFLRFFNSFRFWTLLGNTLGIAVYELIAGFPVPIIFALLLNQLRFRRFKKVLQTVTYAPHFISVVVIAGMLHIFLSPRVGIVNTFLGIVGLDPVFFLGRPELFKSVFVFSGIWQQFGWSSIIYIAALSAINPELYEAATVDGSTRFQRLLHIDIPGIMPTMVILLILNVGHFMQVGFQKILLLQNPMNLSASEVIETYVYKTGILSAQYSYSAAIGLFNALINVVLLVTVNRAARSLSETSLW
jgi:putative aldouronate transport system permease protein